jgi:transposase
VVQAWLTVKAAVPICPDKVVRIGGDYMKIVHPICSGVDVHKNVIVATIAKTDRNNITSYIVKDFPTLNPGLYAFRDWLLEHSCHEVCMESTGKYWIPVFNVLEDHVHVVLVHPKYVRAIKGKKTDKKDSKWIADLFKHDLVRSSFIPPKDIRECREITRYRFKLVNMKSGEKNRYQNSMTVSNIGLASVLSDPFGKTSMGIMEHILTTDVPNEDVCASLIRKSAKKKTAQILDSIRGCDIQADQRFKMAETKSHMDYLDQVIARCELELFVRMQPHWGCVELISDIPGITELSAAIILSEIGCDMEVFEDAPHLCSWAGLTPASNESAGKKKSSRITRAGQFLKPLLVQCALAAIKSKQKPYFAIKYQRIKKRRGHKKAIIAIARMMLVCIYHMLKTGECFSPCDYAQLKDPNPVLRGLTEKVAIEFLKDKGYDVSALVLTM